MIFATRFISYPVLGYPDFTYPDFRYPYLTRISIIAAGLCRDDEFPDRKAFFLSAAAA